METVLEEIRQNYKEREELMNAMVQEFSEKKQGHQESINSEHKLKTFVQRYQSCSAKLVDFYEDKDCQRKEEIESLSVSGSNDFAEFYNRLNSIKDFHEYRSLEEPVAVCPTELTKWVEFTDEEGYGKYLDLHECYQQFINLRGVEKVDYITYLSIFNSLFEIPRECKNTNYRHYLDSLLTYLADYIGRIKPLYNLNNDLEEAKKEFEYQWEQNKFKGWSIETSSALANVGTHLDLSAFSSWEELGSLGLDRLKGALIALGLKCGGTLEERARRLFSTKDETLLSLNLVAKKSNKKTEKGKDMAKQKEIACLEAQVYCMANIVSSQQKATKENVQRKQARTAAEREDSDAEVSASECEEDDDEDQEVVYNPKNLPLGWDGKPIPLWLYKLHGLNISYNCEICGDFTYKGPVAFQKHFVEWRHAHGMRCLGIPNTAHFACVTQIEDAFKLWNLLKAQKQAERWQSEKSEEFEDSLGNVVNRKTYNDLKRQGLL